MKSTLYHRIFMLTLCLSLILLSACSQDVEVSDESSSLASESVNESVPEAVTISGNELFTGDTYYYGNYIMFSVYYGSPLYYVADTKIIDDFANALKACTYTLIEKDSEEYKNIKPNGFFCPTDDYYHIFMFDGIGIITFHKDGSLLEIIDNREDFVYRVSGLDKEAYDAFINCGTESQEQIAP